MADNIRRFGFLGSRELLDTSNNRALVQRVVGNIGHVERLIGVGCASGADALCLDVLLKHGPADLLTIFTAFDVDGNGAAGAASNVRGVQRAATQGAQLRWLSGGGLHLPVGERLATRTRALVNWVAAGGPRSGVFAFLSRANSYGSAAAMKHAATAGLGVIAFPCGIPASALPELGAGQWQPLDGSWVGGYLWQH